MWNGKQQGYHSKTEQNLEKLLVQLIYIFNSIILRILRCLKGVIISAGFSEEDE